MVLPNVDNCHEENLKKSCKIEILQDFFRPFELTFIAERQALEPTYSRNIIKLQIINNQALFGVHSKSKSF